MLDAFGVVEASPLFGVLGMSLGIVFEPVFLGINLGKKDSVFSNKLSDATVKLGLKSENERKIQNTESEYRMSWAFKW